MAGQTEPQFQDDFATPSSAHESYHPIAIQLYGHANKFNATTTNRVRHSGVTSHLWAVGHVACHLGQAAPVSRVLASGFCRPNMTHVL